MLSRLILKPSHFRLLIRITSKPNSYVHASHRHVFSAFLRPLSTGHGGNNSNNNDRSDHWKLSRESDGNFDSFFKEDSGNLSEIAGADSSVSGQDDTWLKAQDVDDEDIFKGIEQEQVAEKTNGGTEDWATADGYKPWSLGEEVKDDVFDIGESVSADGDTKGESDTGAEMEKAEEEKRLQMEEEKLTAVLKGPNRAFGDLIAASGITDEMLDSLIALKDFQGVEGLPPLSEIEDMRYEKNTKKSSRAEIERQKQEEIAKSRVRQVDEKGRAYGTGRRKCSVARVWIQPGDGKFLINDKEFDAYFPVLDQRAALLRPFSETKTLGLWDVKCTVKGGGVTGQVGAIQLGISRALQNWEPDLRPPLRNVGFLTRDPRVVERKKPGKAKARKSFQWVKR